MLSGSKRVPQAPRPMSIQTTGGADFAGTLGDGSDGTRTRDLRRDRPVMALPGLSADGRGFPARAGPFDPSVAGIGGCEREVPGASRGIAAGCDRCPAARSLSRRARTTAAFRGSTLGGHWQARRHPVRDLGDDRVRAPQTAVGFGPQIVEDRHQPARGLRVLADVDHVREEGERRVGNAFGERDAPTEQPRQRTGPAVPKAEPASEPCSARSCASGLTRDAASSASVRLVPRGSTARSPGASATVDESHSRSAEPSSIRWNFATGSPATRNAHGARSSEVQKIVLLTANEPAPRRQSRRVARCGASS